VAGFRAIAVAASEADLTKFLRESVSLFIRILSLSDPVPVRFYAEIPLMRDAHEWGTPALSG